MMMEHLVKDFNNAEKIYGESFMKLATGYDSNAIKKNIKLPEFQRDLKNRLRKKAQELEDENLTDKDGRFTDRGMELASLVLYTEELDNLQAKGLGDKKTKRTYIYGEKENVRNFRKHDRYKDIAVKASI